MVTALPDLGELISNARRSAVHLEMRDGYMRSDPKFIAWQHGKRLDPDDRRSWWNSWHDLTSDAAGRGVKFRRARIVSQPISDYVRFEHDVTFTNIAAGENVRWLDRRHASDLALPGNDFWLIDDRIVSFNIFDGDGELPEEDTEISEDPVVIDLCSTAFEAVWERAIPHEDYKPL